MPNTPSIHFPDDQLAEIHAYVAAEVDRMLAALAQHRDQVLTEAAEIASGVIGPLWHLDTLHEIHGRLLAARSTS